MAIDSTFRTFQHLEDAKCVNETLLRHGFMGTSPEQACLAFSVRVLEAYRQFHQVCPSFSIKGFLKALCRLHKACTLPWGFFYLGNS
jgi:hypothetical protein